MDAYLKKTEKIRRANDQEGCEWAEKARPTIRPV